ncbi:uncharacterized protein [Heterodontus francisci]|uniref:uncharacterized protein isoform X2 n=1 Tax=Heterodontus francisci TaxID=7792 RepID=UPI00355B9F60
MSSQEHNRVKNPDTRSSAGESSVENNEIAFLVGEDGQLHSVQEETHNIWNPENSPVQHNGIQNNRNEDLNEDYQTQPCAAVEQNIPVKESGPALWSGDCRLPAACHYAALQDSRKEESPILNHHSDDMVCNICGKRYKYMSSFWKHRRDHEAKGEFFTAFISRPDAANKSTTDRSGKFCPKKEVNPVSETRLIMVKMEKASPSNSSQGKFHNKGCSSVEDSRLSIIKTEEAAPYYIAEKVSPPSNFNVASRDLPLAVRSRPLPDYFFSCEICGKKYKYKSSFWRHIEDHKNYVVDSTVSDQGWNQIAGSQLTEKRTYNSEQSVRKVIVDVQHHNLLPIRDDKQQVQTANNHTGWATVQHHLESESHHSRKRTSDTALLENEHTKNQATLSSLFKKSTESSENCQLVSLELVDAFASANIPLEKLDHPKLRVFIQRNVQNGGCLPSANKLQKDYLPKVFGTYCEEMKTQINACESFAIICDESSDEQDNYVLHVLFDFMSGKAEDVQSGKLTTVLADCIHLEAVNYTTVSQAIIKTVSKYGADFNKVSAFISDITTYMTKSFKSVLQGVMPNAVHITCNAHIISLVNELWKSEFGKVDKLVSYIKKIFKHCPSRKLRFRQHIANVAAAERAEIGEQNIALPPEPVITHWNSWFRAVQYHAAHLKCYSDFISEELTLTPKTQVLADILTLLNDAQLNEEVQFVAKNATRLLDLITWFESRYVTIHKAYNKVMDVLFWAEAQSNEHHSDNAELNACAQQVFSCMAKKLKQYYCYGEESSGEEKVAQRFQQPSAAFLKAVRIFDPAQMYLLMVDLNSFDAIPGFDKNCRLEIPAYKSIAKEADCTLPVLQFWNSVECRIPHLARLARRCLTIPTISVDMARAMTKHGQVFTT